MTNVIGSRIREVRKSLNMRQLDLSQIVGISNSHLSEIERGRMMPTLPTLQRISEALQRPLEYFVSQQSHQARTFGLAIPRMLISKQALVRFADIVHERSGGEVHIQFYQRALPASLYEQARSIAEGSVHIILDDLMTFEPFAPLCGVAFLPYFFRDRAAYSQFIQSDVFHDHVQNPLLESGIRILNPGTGWEYSSFELLFTNRPIFTPQEMAGLRFRNYGSHPATRLRELLDTVPVDVMWSQAYEAFEQDLIDMFLAPSAYVSSSQLHEVAQYATVVDYGYTQHFVIAINEYAYQNLSPDLQAVLLAALEETRIYFKETVQAQADAMLEKLASEHGIPIIRPDPRLWHEHFAGMIHRLASDPDVLDPQIYAQLRPFMA